MKTTELFVEQTLTGFLVLTAAAAPFLSWETLQELPDEAKGGIDIGSAAGAIGVAYLLGVIFDRSRIRSSRGLIAGADSCSRSCSRRETRRCPRRIRFLSTSSRAR